MAYQSFFKRYEIKYLITVEQQKAILDVMNSYMSLDKYGKTTIRNIYFDTDDYRLIRRSIEKPMYKEKLRIRSYSKVENNSLVYIEMKRKFNGVVYKRRVGLPNDVAMMWASGKIKCPNSDQISNEIDYFIKYYENLKPTVFLSYDREAYYSKDNSSFRVTFDSNVLCRENNLSLEFAESGYSLLEDGYILMEVKCSGGMPLWLVNILSKLKIYKTSFSKYGNAYQRLIFPKKYKNINFTNVEDDNYD